MALSDEVLAVLTDPYETLTRMDLEHREGPVVQFTSSRWTPEQAFLLDDWWDPVRHGLRWRDTVVSKGRNQGVGEITQKFMGWMALTAPDPIHIAMLAHTEPTRDRHINRYHQSLTSLPKVMRPVTGRKTNEMWTWRNGKGSAEGTAFVGMTQGGKTGKGQGFTFHAAHITECGMFPDPEDAQATIGSITATMHATSPYYFLVKESTSSGPRTWWQDEVKRAREDPETNFRFFPWALNPSHRREFRDDRHREEFMGSLTDSDQRAAANYAHFLATMAKEKPSNLRWLAAHYPHLLELGPEALHWRRRKMTAAYGGVEYLFCRDYPMTIDEAFLSGGTGVFDPMYLSEAARKAFPGKRTNTGGVVWLTPDEWHRYAVGVDIAEGVGRDYSVICVVDHRLRQAFVWSDNRTPPEQVGELAVRVATTYNNAILLIEANTRGAEAIKAAKKLGYRHMYANERGGPFRTQGNQFISNKDALYAHARVQMNKDRVTLNDPLTISELLTLEYDRNDSINAKGKKHDDRATAWVLALWAAQRIERFEVNQMDGILDRFGLRDSGARRTIPFG